MKIWGLIGKNLNPREVKMKRKQRLTTPTLTLSRLGSATKASCIETEPETTPLFRHRLRQESSPPQLILISVQNSVN